MVSAATYNMLEFRAMCGRSKRHAVNERTCTKPECGFGRCPIVIYLGDCLQLSLTASLSLVPDANAKHMMMGHTLARRRPALTSSRASMRSGELPMSANSRDETCVPGDVLIELIQYMRRGVPFPPSVWAAFKKCFSPQTAPRASWTPAMLSRRIWMGIRPVHVLGDTGALAYPASAS